LDLVLSVTKIKSLAGQSIRLFSSLFNQSVKSQFAKRGKITKQGTSWGRAVPSSGKAGLARFTFKIELLFSLEMSTI
jgi:hypothetical protein